MLKRVYNDHKQFCRDNGQPVVDLQVNVSDSSKASGAGAFAGVAAADSENENDSPTRDSRRGRRSRGKKEAYDAGELPRGEPGTNAPAEEEIERMIHERNEARRANNYPLADSIRDNLIQRGIALMDEPGGRGKGAEVTTWRYWRD